MVFAELSVRAARQMNDIKQKPQPQGLKLADVYYVLFRRKWIILAFCAMAVLAGVTVFMIKPPRYRTEADLFIRYVVEERSPSPPGDQPDTRLLNNQEAGILDTEARIIRSLDVARRVVDVVGANRILGTTGQNTNRDEAAARVLGFLKVQIPSSGSVISVSYEHPDPEVAQQVLSQVIVAYVNKHKEMHQPAEIFGSFITTETARLREQLHETEQKLKEAKAKAGVISLDDAKKAYADQRVRIREQLFDAQAALAEHQAVLGGITNAAAADSETDNTVPQIPVEQLNAYKNVCARLDRLYEKKQDLRTQYTEDSAPVRDVQRQIEENEKLKHTLQEDYPLLSAMVVTFPLSGARASAPSVGVPIDPQAEALRVRALRSKIEVLNSQLGELQREAAKIDAEEDTIRDLQRKRELLDADLKYFLSNLEQSRVEGALGAGKAPNIGVIQSPSPPRKMWSPQFKKKLGILLGGCVACGFALAFLIEMLLDRSVKRPTEVETKLHLPLFVTIPDLRWNGNHRLANADLNEPLHLTRSNAAAGGSTAEESSAMQIVASYRSNPLRRFYEGLRDRLIVYFDVRNATKKPKLVAVTSCSKGAGVTSTAVGLAASLSETSDGNVLLVSTDAESGSAQEFHNGRPYSAPTGGIAGNAKKSTLLHDNLRVASEPTEDTEIAHELPGGFSRLVPKLKASDYDYIIFDLPPVSQTSMTARAARNMDIVLLVVEAGKTNQDIAKQAAFLLAESKAVVSVVLNKTRTYVPAWLHQEYLDG